MRTFILTVTIMVSTSATVQADPIRSLQFPQDGAFCGFMTLCGAGAEKPAAPEEE